MVGPILSIIVILLIIILAEYAWRKRDISTEISRKFVHIFVATFVAFWPLYIPWHTIALMSLSLLLVVLISMQLNLFKSIHSIERNTWGEILYAGAIVILSISIRDAWIFAAAMLHLGLADGLAALAGKYFGKNNRYEILGSTKSLAGTATFYAVSVLIIAIVGVYWGHVGWWYVLVLPPIATYIENVGILGTDNLLIPLFIAYTLR